MPLLVGAQRGPGEKNAGDFLKQREAGRQKTKGTSDLKLPGMDSAPRAFG